MRHEGDKKLGSLFLCLSPSVMSHEPGRRFEVLYLLRTGVTMLEWRPPAVSVVVFSLLRCW